MKIYLNIEMKMDKITELIEDMVWIVLCTYLRMRIYTL